MRSGHKISGGARGLRVVAALLGSAFLGVTFYLAVMQAVMPQGEAPPRRTAEDLRKLTPGELSDAYAAAQAAFARNPLDAKALSQLSRIAETRGDREAAERLKLIAGEMQPRNLSIQSEALAILLQRRDFASAMMRIDGLVRARPNQRDALFAAAAAIAADPEGRKAVARKLAEDPPWRWQFLASTIASGNPEVARQIISELRVIGSPASAKELGRLIDHYLERGNVDAAYAAWLSSLSAREVGRVRLVYDGGFDEEIRGLRFDWTVRPAQGLAYRVFPRNTASMDMTLQIDFLDFQGGFANLSQILRLRPGRYRLGGEARFEAFQSPTGVVFRIHCLGGGKPSPLDETRPLPQSGQWIAFEKTFTVPASGCTDQLLRLESQTDREAAGVTRGQVSLDNITIDSLPALAQ